MCARVCVRARLCVYVPACVCLRTCVSASVCLHASVCRSWEEHEKRKQQQARCLQRERSQIQLKVQRSVKSLISMEDEEHLNCSLTNVPGFRYRANGEERKTEDDTRKLRLIKSFAGTSVCFIA